MTRHLTLIILCFIVFNVYSQKSNIEISFGYQKHDKRFFGISDINAKKEGDWGTGYMGIMFKRQIYNSSNLKLKAGLGYAREINTFLTPYDHCFDNPGGPCSDVLTWIEKYSIDMVPISFASEFQLNQKLSFELDIKPQFYFYKNVNDRTFEFKLGLYSIELNPSLKYSVDRFYVSLGSRLAQLKTIDKVYSYGNIFMTEHPRYTSWAFDRYNPVKVILTVGYKLGKPLMAPASISK